VSLLFFFRDVPLRLRSDGYLDLAILHSEKDRETGSRLGMEDKKRRKRWEEKQKARELAASPLPCAKAGGPQLQELWNGLHKRWR